jgi:hypothetical protein
MDGSVAKFKDVDNIKPHPFTMDVGMLQNEQKYWAATITHLKHRAGKLMEIIDDQKRTNAS